MKKKYIYVAYLVLWLEVLTMLYLISVKAKQSI